MRWALAELWPTGSSNPAVRRHALDGWKRPGLFWVSGGDERCVRGRSAHHGELALPPGSGRRTRGEARGLSLTGVPKTSGVFTQIA